MLKKLLTVAVCLALLPQLAFDRLRFPSSGLSGDPSQATAQPGAPSPTAPETISIQTSTPRPDGAIIHQVQPGQTVFTIAAAYGVSVQDILHYNGLTEKSVIFPGDFLLIQLPATPTGSETPTSPNETGSAATGGAPTKTPSQPTAIPTRTRTPTRTLANPTSAASTAAPLQAQSQAPPPLQAETRPDYLLLAIGALGLLGAALVLLGNILKRVE
jgi:LysM repeat protein